MIFRLNSIKMANTGLEYELVIDITGLVRFRDSCVDMSESQRVDDTAVLFALRRPTCQSLLRTPTSPQLLPRASSFRSIQALRLFVYRAVYAVIALIGCARRCVRGGYFARGEVMNRMLFKRPRSILISIDCATQVGIRSRCGLGGSYPDREMAFWPRSHD